MLVVGAKKKVEAHGDCNIARRVEEGRGKEEEGRWSFVCLVEVEVEPACIHKPGKSMGEGR